VIWGGERTAVEIDTGRHAHSRLRSSKAGWLRCAGASGALWGPGGCWCHLGRTGSIDATWVKLEAFQNIPAQGHVGCEGRERCHDRRRHRKQPGTAASTQPGLSREAQIRLFPFSSSLVRVCQPGVAAAPNLAPVAQIRLFPFSSSLVTVC
jgi:hypothetical protein